MITRIVIALVLSFACRPAAGAADPVIPAPDPRVVIRNDAAKLMTVGRKDDLLSGEQGAIIHDTLERLPAETM